jgi:hypothetical protein
MSIHQHAVQRIADRLIVNGIPLETVHRLASEADDFASTHDPFGSYALRWSIPNMVGQAWSDLSNGDTIVAVVRGGIVGTFMFRRRTQPFTRDALNVDKVVNL